MKKIIIALLFATIGVAAMAQDAEYLLLRHTYTVNDDGTTDINIRKELRLLRLRSLSAFGETYVVYNPAFEQVTINELYTERADGSRVEPPKDAIVMQLPSQCAACARFNGLREMAVVHTALELGATIVMDYTVHRKTNILDVNLQLQQPCPVDRLEVRVQVPGSQQLAVEHTVPIFQAANCKELSNDHQYSLEATDVQSTIVDSYLPPATMLYDQLSISNGLRPQLELTIDDIVDADALLTELRQRDAMAYAVALRDYVRDMIRLNAIGPRLLNYQLASASQVWQSGCGTPEEKTALLVSLLRRAGFTAVVNEQDYESAIVNINNMDHLLQLGGRGNAIPLDVAREELKTVAIDSTLEWQPDDLTDGYYRLRLPADRGTSALDAAQLTSMRVAPVLAQPCDETYDYTVPLPRGYKLIGDAVKQKLAFDGLGSVEITIKQSGKTLKVHRHLVVEQAIIDADHYANFRQLMQLWSQHREVMVKGK